MNKVTKIIRENDGGSQIIKEFEILSEGENLQNAIKSLKKGDFALVKAKIDVKRKNPVNIFPTILFNA